jgi:hypothetical protein
MWAPSTEYILLAAIFGIAVGGAFGMSGGIGAVAFTPYITL